MLNVSKYLHDLGVCLHFHKDPILKQTVILKPEWGTSAVYKVLDTKQVRDNLGCFTREEATAIWQDAEYANMHDELLQLMKSFKLCYEIPGRPNTFISPQLLDIEQPDYNWDDSHNLILRYEYEFMPKGILTSFIVEMHQFIEQQKLVWQTGVVLNNGRARAEVTENRYKDEIKIRVSGVHRKELLSVIDYKFFEIHRSFERLQYNTRVPCNCETCVGSQTPYAYNLDKLHKFLEDRQYEIQCQESYHMVDVRNLLNDVEIDRKASISEEAHKKQEEKLAGFNIQVAQGNVVIQQSETGDISMTQQPQDPEALPKKTKAKSSWANGLFYLFVFVVVIAALNFVAGNVPPATLALIILGGMLFIPMIGALQLRQDDQLSEKSFLELMKMVVEQLPLLKTFLNFFKQPSQPGQ